MRVIQVWRLATGWCSVVSKMSLDQSARNTPSRPKLVDSALTWTSWYLRPDSILKMLCYGNYSIRSERRSMTVNLLGQPHVQQDPRPSPIKKEEPMAIEGIRLDALPHQFGKPIKPTPHIGGPRCQEVPGSGSGKYQTPRRAESAYPSGEPRLSPPPRARKLAECYGFRAAFQAVGFNSATLLIGHVPSLGRTSPRYSLNLMSNRRQVSTIEMIAAIFGPARSSPRCSQFFRPSAIGRIAPSHQLLSISI